MEQASALNHDVGNVSLGKAEGDITEVEGLNRTFDDILKKVTQVRDLLKLVHFSAC